MKKTVIFKDIQHRIHILNMDFAGEQPTEKEFLDAIPDPQFLPLGLLKHCSCGVPFDIHGTCCGWVNAKTEIDEVGKICDSRHPSYGKNFNDWINQRFCNAQ